MTIKSFGFLNPTNPANTERNWRTLDTNTKFGTWVPTLADLTDAGTEVAYFQLYGPMVYYYIYLRSYGDIHGVAGRLIQPGADPRISLPPYSPETPSGKKAIQNNQWLDCVDEKGFELAPGQKAILSAVASTPYIGLPVGWANVNKIYIYGWFFRDP